MIEKCFENERDALTVRITPFTLNSVQREHPVLAAKEEQGWWIGSIRDVVSKVKDLTSQPTIEQVAAEAAEYLAEIGIQT